MVKKQVDRDGFCKNSCKQAYYRARKMRNAAAAAGKKK